MSSKGMQAGTTGQRAAYSAGVRVLGPVYARAGSAYLAGREQSTALAVAERLLASGSEITLGYWPSKDESAADVAAEEHSILEALGHLRAFEHRTTLSLKAARLGFDADAVRKLAKLAVERHTRLVFDAHSPAEADRTLELARLARAEGASTGVALPARWARSSEDAVMASEFGLSVRVVKGQWPDDVPGCRLNSEAALRSSCLNLLDRLAGLSVRTAVATHDVVLLKQALPRLSDWGKPPEVELLLGLPVRPALTTARRAGASTRFYVSYGHPGLPYPFRAALRRPRLAWLLTQGVVLAGRNQTIQRRGALG
jgi:proline dehydrogenase